MNVEQISIFLENKPGRLEEVTRIFEDHFIPEIINPKTGEALPWGMTGELVFNTITKEAFPVIRYRTRDLSVLHPEPCRCGRTIVRMGRIQGRSDDMLIIRGVNVFPSQIESVIMETKTFEPHYQLVVERRGSLDHLRIEVEAQPGVEPAAFEVLAREAVHHIKSMIGVSAEITIVAPGSLPRSQGKAARVRDLRQCRTTSA